MPLRPYQEEAIQAVRNAFWAGENRLIIGMATGLGKTPVIASIKDKLELKNRILVIENREELINQVADHVHRWTNHSVGIEKAEQHCSDSDDIVIASVQTIGRGNGSRILKFDPSEFGAVIVDECHASIAPTYGNVLEHFRVFEDTQRLLLGLSATLKRGDGRALNKVYQKVVYNKPILEGINEGWLSDLKGRRIRTTTSLDRVSTQAGDFNVGELGQEVNEARRNRAVVDGWLAFGQNRQTVVFSVNVAHAQALAEQFRCRGVKAEAVWGDDPERAAKLAAHRRKDLAVLVNCNLLTEGYDDWRVGCLVLARPTKSELLYTQMVGRGTRIPPGINNLITAREQGLWIEKEDCIVLDVVDNTSRHSLTTLPSLFGLNPKLDLAGKSLSGTIADVEQIKEQNPAVDLTNVDSTVDNLKVYAEQVDLFKTEFTQEILQFSEFQWHKVGNAYVLLLDGGESVTVTEDYLGAWSIFGSVKANQIRGVFSTLREAIEEADYKIRLHGGRAIVSMIARVAAWHNRPPTPAQRLLCRNLGLPIPAGANAGQVAMKMRQEVLRRRKMKEQRLTA